MYKLFLCLRYLRSRLIAYFAVAAVGLCVAMMLIVISVMDGFVRKIEKAAKGLFSDIVVVSASTDRGIGMYEEFIERLKKDVPEVEEASPFILTGGWLYVPDLKETRMVQIAGVEPGTRARVSDFANGLWIQKGAANPSFNPPVDLLTRRIRQEAKAADLLQETEKGKTEAAERMRSLLYNSSLRAELAARRFDARQGDYDALAKADEAWWAAKRAGKGQEDTPAMKAAETRRNELSEAAGMQPPSYRAIVGLGIPGLSFRTQHGDTVRRVYPGERIALSVVPIGRPSLEAGLVNEKFTVIDDCETGVASIDSMFVYVPFRTLQALCDMDAKYSADRPGEVAIPARCSAIHVKARGNLTDEKDLRAIRDKVEACWLDFSAKKGNLDEFGHVAVYTWRQQQDKLVSQVEAQRTIVVIMFGVISLVAVVLIIVIFYMIVMQKTWDIGVLMAMGASRPGIAGIFLAYGAAVGLVGAVGGTILGWVFVHNINAISDYIAEHFGFRVWDREFFMFRQIPNDVDPMTVVRICLAAVAAGLIGALIPAIRAARMQPVEALRYE